MNKYYEPDRDYYRRASEALDAAYKACFNHPDRPPLGMSHGPFSGVNEVLGMVSELERTLRQKTRDMAQLSNEMAVACAAVAFALEQIDDHFEREDFLRSWLEGDIGGLKTEWPEFGARLAAQGGTP
jgi:hypothetical protein